jgi:hypothetical protein
MNDPILEEILDECLSLTSTLGCIVFLGAPLPSECSFTPICFSPSLDIVVSPIEDQRAFAGDDGIGRWGSLDLGL